MTEEEKPQEQPQTAEPAAPETSEAPSVDTKEIADGKTFAILSYALSFIGLPFFLVPLIMRNNAFSLYHAKQCLLLWIAGIALSMVSGVLMAVCIGFVLMSIAAIFLLVLSIMGLVNAVKEEMKPVPLVGKWAENWFKGIKKA